MECRCLAYIHTYIRMKGHRIESSERTEPSPIFDPFPEGPSSVKLGARVQGFGTACEGHDVDMFKGKKSRGRDGAMDAGRCVI